MWRLFVEFHSQNIVKLLLEKARFISFVGIVSLLFASAFTFVLGAVKTVRIMVALVASAGTDSLAFVHLIQIMDVFLVATALWIFAVSLHELFIGPLDLPSWMVAHNLYELKTKLGSVLILVMAGTFVERLTVGGDASQLMCEAIAIAVVSVVLIALGYTNKSD
jgi:uncharacterized membrane protein YqhA